MSVIVQLIERLAEDQLVHVVVRQKRAGKAQVKLADLLQFRQILAVKLKRQATQIVLELLEAARPQDGDDVCAVPPRTPRCDGEAWRRIAT